MEDLLERMVEDHRRDCLVLRVCHEAHTKWKRDRKEWELYPMHQKICRRRYHLSIAFIGLPESEQWR